MDHIHSVLTSEGGVCGRGSLERDESGGVGGPNARPAVLHWFVGYSKLPKVVPYHLRLGGREARGESSRALGNQFQFSDLLK